MEAKRAGTCAADIPEPRLDRGCHCCRAVLHGDIGPRRYANAVGFNASGRLSPTHGLTASHATAVDRVTILQSWSPFVDQTSKPKLRMGSGHYDTNYGNFHAALYEQVRRDAFGDDIGQNSWLTATEQDKFRTWLLLQPGQRLLDVGCGAGGPALRLCFKTGCSVTGVDIHEQGIAAAQKLSADRNLSHLTDFRVVDADSQLPFPDATFDVITCIDAINHFSGRSRLLADWARLLKPGGRILYTDPIVVTGPLTGTEIAERSSIGFYLFVPKGYNEHVIAESRLRLVLCEDVTDNMAEIAERRKTARQQRAAALREIEGEQAYEAQQCFLGVASLIARERRLSRFVFVAEKPA